jgi:hypothetical protein
MFNIFEREGKGKKGKMLTEIALLLLANLKSD